MPPRKVAKPKKKMPAFTKPSAETLAAFARATDMLPGIERRVMFGYPAIFLNDNMLSSIFQDRIMVRLSEADRAKAVQSVGARPFEPSPGRGMREYVEFPATVSNDTASLRKWIERGSAYVATLPAKKQKRQR